MKMKGKTMVWILIGIVVVMAFVIYFLFTFIQNRGLVDESMALVNMM
ncbi:flagellar basal body-associated protein FliL [Alkalibacillus filiformis]|uniref:Flagellar basal body-associated protein FliL n=1 Tax=Alkalibacillus filiformis TaxID=200990 RepID=A0ABU0DUS8_9BACI|nr:hypothetical protein [Alkalibacillus filiformis]MDQ0352214.1 flagellar basal body-associated protein FliL [Alkalibacillus filiformis]